MKLSRSIVALLMVCSPAPVAIAQSGIQGAGASEQYAPRLADIMSTAQLRHMKLWFAGESPNWKLAAYEFRQLKASLAEAASLYPGIPVTSITTMATPIQSVADAIEAKDEGKFAKKVGELTVGCNACHQSIGRGFIVMRVPTASPFSDQLFPPQPPK
jgi:hypothetical protein